MSARLVERVLGVLLPQGKGWIMAFAPREQAHPSSRDVHPRHALASDPLPLLSLSLRVLKDPTCLSLSLPPPTQ